MSKFILIVEGGIVQSIISTSKDNEVCIVDLDNILVGDTNDLLFNNVDVFSESEFNNKLMYFKSIIEENILNQEPEKLV